MKLIKYLGIVFIILFSLISVNAATELITLDERTNTTTTGSGTYELAGSYDINDTTIKQLKSEFTKSHITLAGDFKYKIFYTDATDEFTTPESIATDVFTNVTTTAPNLIKTVDIIEVWLALVSPPQGGRIISVKSRFYNQTSMISPPSITFDTINFTNNSFFNNSNINIFVNVTTTNTNNNIFINYTINQETPIIFTKNWLSGQTSLSNKTFTNPIFARLNYYLVADSPYNDVTATEYCINSGYISANLSYTSTLYPSANLAYYDLYNEMWSNIFGNSKTNRTASLTCIKSPLTEGNYNISFNAYNNETDVTSSMYYFTIDTLNPIINLSNSTELNSYTATWSNYFNYSDTNLDTCYLIVENSSQSCSSYTFSENGNQSVEIYVNDSAGNIVNQNFTLFVNPYQYFYFEDPANNPIVNFTFGETSYNDYTIIKTYDLGLGNHTLEFIKYGYANTNVSFILNTTSNINLTTEIQISLLYISIYDVETLNLITQTINIDLIGDSFAGSFSTSNGSIIISNITELPDIYELNLESSNYEILTYYFQHTGYAAVSLNLYMQNTSSTVPIKYIIRNSFGDPYDTSTCLVELGIYQISSNSYESFVMDYTNSIAEVIFNLDTSENYKPTVTCGSQIQIYDGGKITSTPVYLKFSQSNLEIFPTIPTISSDITFVSVSNSTGRFKFTYNDLNNIISEACLNITMIDYNSETFVEIQCLSTSSGSINVDFNTTAGLTYKAYGLVTYEGEINEVNTYYKKIFVAEFDFGIWGVIFGLVITGLLAIGGFFMGKAKGVLLGTTAGLWIMSFAVFGVWFMPVTTSLIIWSVLLIVGIIFTS